MRKDWRTENMMTATVIWVLIGWSKKATRRVYPVKKSIDIQS